MEPPIKELLLTRIFSAPRDKVFRAFTDERLMAHWWGPKGFTNVCELDVRAGGSISIHMTGPDGKVYPMAGLFRVVDPPMHLLITSAAFQDDNGDYKLQNNNSFTFDEKDGRTKLILRVEVVNAAPETYSSLNMMEQGWKESFDRLEALLKNINQNQTI